MAVSYTAESVGNLLKKYYETGVTKQFFDDNVFLKRIEKNSRDIKGGTATCGLHAGRNPGVGAASNGGEYGTPGKQSIYQTTIPLKYNYAPTRLSGPDIENSKGNAAAFADMLSLNQDGAVEDMKRDLARQLFADGTGILALATADVSTATYATAGWLWKDPSLYLPDGKELQVYALSDGSTTRLNADARATATTVASTTVTGDAMASFTADSDVTTSVGAGDFWGTYGALQLANATSITQYECMGLAGLVHNTDLPGSSAYKYDAGDFGNTGITNALNAEIAAVTAAGHDFQIGSNTNTVQGLATASYNWWKSLVYGNAGVPRAISFSLLDRMIANLKVMRGSKLSAMYTTWQVQQKIVDLIRADRRYPDTMEIDGGLKVNSYQGVPILVSQDCPSRTLFMLDESEFVFYDKKGYFFLADAKGNIMHKTSQQDLYEITGAVYCNLGCRSRWRQGKIIDILE